MRNKTLLVTLVLVMPLLILLAHHKPLVIGDIVLPIIVGSNNTLIIEKRPKEKDGVPD